MSARLKTFCPAQFGQMLSTSIIISSGSIIGSTAAAAAESGELSNISVGGGQAGQDGVVAALRRRARRRRWQRRSRLTAADRKGRLVSAAAAATRNNNLEWALARPEPGGTAANTAQGARPAQEVVDRVLLIAVAVHDAVVGRNHGVDVGDVVDVGVVELWLDVLAGGKVVGGGGIVDGGGGVGHRHAGAKLGNIVAVT